ncbi:hypothetical protein CDAR_477461 [Caerostris darwini]|uniref:Uncharacterized protein n=1 Tax=Caerostris darwini TaxID=1538125 RepID=A0AAV4STL7_9ARAC|nr:hypothetical protein CDAR_477461 [Caerostris darwini]
MHVVPSRKEENHLFLPPSLSENKLEKQDRKFQEKRKKVGMKDEKVLIHPNSCIGSSDLNFKFEKGDRRIRILQNGCCFPRPSKTLLQPS